MKEGTSLEAQIAELLASGGSEGHTFTDIEGRYLRTDEYIEGMRSLEMARRCAKLARKDEYYWKWVLISVHGAVQAFMVIALKKSDGFDVMTNKSVSEWLVVHRLNDNGDYGYPDLKMESFLGLFRRVKRVWHRQLGNFFQSRTNEKITKSIKKMHSEFRNNFVHFTPKSWSIEISGMPGILLDCLEVVDFCGWHCTDTVWYIERRKRDAKIALDQLRRELISLQRKYA